MKEPNRAPYYACLYHALCGTARKHGYALAIHGSVVTDLDLIAIPWTEEAADPIVLRDALMGHIDAVSYGDIHRRMGFTEDFVKQIEANELKTRVGPHDETGAAIKPHGRRAWNLYMDAGCKVDLSVMPLGSLASTSAQAGKGGAKS